MKPQSDGKCHSFMGRIFGHRFIHSVTDWSSWLGKVFELSLMSRCVRGADMSNTEKSLSNEERQHQRLSAFVQMLSDYTGYWDDLCDCPFSDGVTPEHAEGCQTLNIRKDEEYAWSGGNNAKD